MRVGKELLWATLVLFHSWVLLSMATSWSSCRPPRLRLAEKRSRRRVTCLLFVKARTWSAVSLLPTPQKHKEPFLPASPFSLTQRQAAGKSDGWWFRFLLWGRPFASDKDYNLAHLTEYKSLKFVFLVTSDYIYIHKKFQTKRHTSKSSPSSYPLPALFPSSETATVIRLFCPSDDIHSSNPTFYRGFLIKRKE